MATSATSDAIVDIEGEAAAPPGQDRRRGVAFVFVLCLAVGGATIGRDGPEATAPEPTAQIEHPRMLVGSPGAGFGSCVVLHSPDRLASEPLTNLRPLTPVVGATEVITSEPPLDRNTVWIEGEAVANAGQTWVLRCVEETSVTRLISNRRSLSDPLPVAGPRP